MTIAEQITRIKTNIANAYTAITNKGGTLPTTQNSENLASAIESISSGSNINFTISDYIFHKASFISIINNSNNALNISSEGVVSNFSLNSYLTIDASMKSTDNATYCYELTTGDSVTDNYIQQGDNFPNIDLLNSQFKSWSNSASANYSLPSDGTVSTSTTYRITMFINGTSRTLSLESVDDNIYTSLGSVTFENTDSVNTTDAEYLGRDGSQGRGYFHGAINLAKSYIQLGTDGEKQYLWV